MSTTLPGAESVAPASRLLVDPSLVIGDVDPRIYGSFVEHMGRGVYDGIFDPDHPTADADGFREDVAELVRELAPTILRYPGGNFVSGYRWEDGVGPVEERPRRRDLAWRSTEPNLVGTNEFMRYCQKVGADPMLAVNLGSRGVEAAAALVEYCNHSEGSYYSDLRRSHGVRDPHGVKVWCLGNELDGPWQIGHVSADEYGRIAAQSAVAMRRADPSIELVACGTSKPIMPTFATWESTMLRYVYEQVDFVSMHMYVDPDLYRDVPSLLASGLEIDSYLDSVIASVDYARAAGKHQRKMALSFDEWNVWYNSRPRPIGEWPVAPELIGDLYSHADALVVGSFLNSMLRRADRVRMACLAQLVNVIAPIRTEQGGGAAWKQATFAPFALASRFGRGEALQVGVTTGRHDTSAHEDVPTLDVAAVRDPHSGVITFFVVNRSLTHSVPLDLQAAGFPGARGAAIEVRSQTAATPQTQNSVEAPAAVGIGSVTRLAPGESPLLPPASWSMVQLLPTSAAATLL